MVGTVVKSKIFELEEEVRAGSSISTRNNLNGVLQVVFGDKRFLVIFQYGYKKNLSSNQLTIMIVEKIPEEKEPEISKIAETVELEKGYYRCVY